MTKRIAVIGAGIAGLSCAYELQKAGYNVTVFEKNNYVGGRMATRTRNGLAFDIGANFFISHYKNTKAYCTELGIKEQWQQMKLGKNYTLRNGKYCALSLNSVWSVLHFSPISLLSRIRLLFLFLQSGWKAKEINFFDLSSAPKELDETTAYEYVRKKAGKDVADYIIDGFVSTYQFHSAREISTVALFALMGLMTNDPGGFTKCHTMQGMSTIPEALAKRLDVRLSSPVLGVEATTDGLEVLLQKKHRFDVVVLASQAPHTKIIYKNPTQRQQKVLDAVRYATTINVSFAVPTQILGDVCCVTVPSVENPAISEYSNEAMKCVGREKTLVNIGLHEAFAKKIIEKSDEEIFALVKKEFGKACPPLQGDISIVENHDLQRWSYAMPKFNHGYVSLVKDFWKHGQGENNVYFCGDYLNCPWIEGSITCGKKVAKLIEEAYQ